MHLLYEFKCILYDVRFCMNIVLMDASVDRCISNVMHDSDRERLNMNRRLIPIISIITSYSIRNSTNVFS